MNDINQDFQQKIQHVRLALFDVDGVLSDGQIYLSNSGDEYKPFHIQDGLGIKLLLSTGVEVGIISGRYSSAVKKRMQALGVVHVFQNCQDKLPIYQALCQKLSFTNDQVAYTGDDLPDLPLIQTAGVSFAVSNAIQPVRDAADWVTQRVGGAGAVREICELIMQVQQTWEGVLARFSTS